MKTIYWPIGVIVAVVLVVFVFGSHNKSSKLAGSQATSTTIGPVELTPISHATFILKWNGKAIYSDPVGGAEAFKGQSPADIVLVTDIHPDHFSTSTLEAIVGTSTTLIVPQAVKDLLPAKLAARALVIRNSEATSNGEFRVYAMPMYNLPESPTTFHTKGRGNGYVVSHDNFRLYIAGDTSGTPEMRALTDIDMALIPMNLPYTMSVDEAADAVLSFKPKYVFPFHYKGQDGLSDIGQFKKLVNDGNLAINVMLMNWYPVK